MTSQTQYWNRLIQPGIVALVGAGGKTTVLSKLVEYGRLQGQPIVVTTTTQRISTMLMNIVQNVFNKVIVAPGLTVLHELRLML